MKGRPLEPIRALADKVIDTSDFNVHPAQTGDGAAVLRRAAARHMALFFTSFGYKYGIPHEHRYDSSTCAFCPTRILSTSYARKTGLDLEVRDYVLGNQETRGLSRSSVCFARVYLCRFTSARERAVSLWRSVAPAAGIVPLSWFKNYSRDLAAATCAFMSSTVISTEVISMRQNRQEDRNTKQAGVARARGCVARANGQQVLGSGEFFQGRPNDRRTQYHGGAHAGCDPGQQDPGRGQRR